MYGLHDFSGNTVGEKRLSDSGSAKQKQIFMGGIEIADEIHTLKVGFFGKSPRSLSGQTIYIIFGIIVE